ncbi:MAG: arsenic resistance N-acetyltransferase ArsN2 [Balneolales bacterium]|nr:arsenic resistance N-acetyltransferase ArsN2 [Balneolales bacterium]
MSEFRRQHPIAMITQLASVLRQNLVPLVIFFVLGAQNSQSYFFEIFWIGLASAFIFGIAGWFRFTFRVHEGELQINKGVFVRKKLYLSKERIQVIDVTEGIIQRVFGLVQVEVKSAGGGTEKATISAITKEEAEELQNLLRKDEVNEEITETEEIQKEEELSWKLPSRDLFFAALTSGNFGLIASILTATSGQLDQFFTEENLNYIIDILPGYSEFSIIIWVVVIILFLSYLFSFIGVILRYSDFKITRKEKEILITSGLLERKQITVPFNRIQAIRFVEGILRQPFGYGMVYVESAGFEQKNNERSIVLHPFLRKELLGKLFDEFNLEFVEPESVVTPPKRALFRYIRRPNYLLLLVPLIWIFWEHAPWLFLLSIPLSMFGWLEYKDAELAFSSRFMRLQYRQLAKGTAFLKRNRAQAVESSVNPFQHRKQLQSIHVTVASGSGGRTFSIQDLENKVFPQVGEWISTMKNPGFLAPVSGKHIEEVKALLGEYDLPVSDLEDSKVSLFSLRENEELKGCVGLEVFDEEALLRSLAVHPDNRGTGLGWKIVGEIEEVARKSGVHTLYLLTETAESFFSRFGYSTINRAEVPLSIQQSKEFSELCAETAVAMRKEI